MDLLRHGFIDRMLVFQQHKLLESLAREFRDYATGRKESSQVFITTHQPYFVDALSPEEVWGLEKGADAFSNLFDAYPVADVRTKLELCHHIWM